MIKFKDILDEVKLVPRRSKEERQKKHAVQLNNVIKHYSKQSPKYFEEHPEKKDLNLSNLKFEPKLPDNLTVYGNLFLTSTPITSLPDNLEVGRVLDLGNTPIKQLPSGLEVDGYLDLTKTQIKELPSDLKVGGGLALRNTPIKELPDNLEVGGDLHLGNTQIKELPSDLKVGGSLFLKDTPISKKYTEEQLKKMLPNVKGYIQI